MSFWSKLFGNKGSADDAGMPADLAFVQQAFSIIGVRVSKAEALKVMYGPPSIAGRFSSWEVTSPGNFHKSRGAVLIGHGQTNYWLRLSYDFYAEGGGVEQEMFHRVRDLAEYYALASEIGKLKGVSRFVLHHGDEVGLFDLLPGCEHPLNKLFPDFYKFTTAQVLGPADNIPWVYERALPGAMRL